MTSFWRHSRLTYYDLGPNFLTQGVELFPGEVWQVSKQNSQYFRSYLRTGKILNSSGSGFGEVYQLRFRLRVKCSDVPNYEQNVTTPAAPVPPPLFQTFTGPSNCWPRMPPANPPFHGESGYHGSDRRIREQGGNCEYFSYNSLLKTECPGICRSLLIALE